MRLKYTMSEDYIYLERRAFKLIRKYILHLTKKYVAAVCGVDESTLRRVENIHNNIRKSTYQKVIEYYHLALVNRGWKLEVEHV